MITSLNANQASAANRMSRDFPYTGGLSQFLNDVLAEISAGAVGITADARDIDSLALGGGTFGQDDDTTSGLTFGHLGGRLFNGNAIVSVAAGTVLLSSSTTNYVEVSRAGVVSKNTVGFTSGAIPLYEIVTGASSISIVSNRKTLLGSLPDGGITGAMVTTANATKELNLPLGSISATTSFSIIVPAVAGVLARVSFVTATGVTTSDTDNWTFALVNKGASGSGTTVMVDGTDAANSTKATGGTAMTANVKRSLTLSSTPANLVTASEDVLVLTFTKTGSATTMAQCTVRLDFTHTA